MVQTASTTTMHLNILTGFQLRIREALRWVSPTSDSNFFKMLQCLQQQEWAHSCTRAQTFMTASSAVGSLCSSRLVYQAFSQLACLNHLLLSEQGACLLLVACCADASTSAVCSNAGAIVHE